MVRMAAILEQVKKKYGSESLNQIKNLKNHQSRIPRFSSGSLILDRALGGGWPLGRIIELWGEEGGGKTTIALHAIAEVQKEKKGACLIDMEHALDEEWAVGLGVNIDDLYLSTPDTGEQALEIALAVIEAQDIDLVIIDSVSALIPKAEIEGEIGDSHVGLQARMMSQAMRKMVGAVSKSKTTVMFTNQIRHKIGVVFGNPEVGSGGQALKFYASIRCKISRGKQITEGSTVVGNKIRFYTMKNKTAPPFQKCEVDLYYNGGGIRQDSELASLMLEKGMIYKNGAMYTLPAKFDFDKMLNGSEEVLLLSDLIRTYPDEERNKIRGYDQVLKSIRQNLNMQKTGKEVLKKSGVI